MATDLTPAISSLAPEPTIEGRSESGQETRATRFDLVTRTPITSQEREAILVSLHEERRRLTQAKRLGQATKADDEYLAELKDYIDEWQAMEVATAKQSDDVWARFEAVASTLLEARAEIMRQSKK